MLPRHHRPHVDAEALARRLRGVLERSGASSATAVCAIACVLVERVGADPDSARMTLRALNRVCLFCFELEESRQ